MVAINNKYVADARGRLKAPADASGRPKAPADARGRLACYRCDRVLWTTKACTAGLGCRNLAYGSLGLLTSDHKPVYPALYIVMAYIVMAPYNHGLYSYGLYSYGPISSWLHIVMAPYSHGSI